MNFGQLAEAIGGADWQRVALGALFIFLCRISDVSIDTLRVISIVKGQRVLAAVFGMVASGIFIVALATVFRPPIHWLQMVGYAAGFGVGTLVGMTLAARLSAEFVLLRVLSRPPGGLISDRLRSGGFAVTAVAGEGRDGPVEILFSVVRRSQARKALDLVRAVDAKAFVVLEPVQHGAGGYVPRFIGPGVAVRR
ncbi:MAG: DUF5698 domain-containing protein [Planctomycetota bacterium]|nr:DUF5698 domain-containing protein [Planctomycetota bacterium]